MSDYELLSYNLGGIKLQDATAITFLAWVAGKLNGISSNSPARSELAMLVSSPVLGRMTDERKIEIIRKLESMGVTIA